MGIGRKLEDIHQGLTLLEGQWGVTGFLTNTENAQEINGLVEDLHEAMMDYQVCVPNCPSQPCLTSVSDFTATRYL